MSFVARTPRPDEWKAVVSLISALIDEATFDVTPEGLSFKAMDPSHVAMIELFWPNTGFEAFRCDGEVRFTVRVADLTKYLRRASRSDSITLSMSAGGGLLLREEGRYRKEFEMHLIEGAYGPTRSPRFSFNSRSVLDVEIFRDILKDVKTVSDHVTIEAMQDRLRFSAKSEAGSLKAELLVGQPELKEHEVKEESRSTYSIRFMEDIANPAVRLANEITLEFSSKLPLRLGFGLGETGGRIDFYLAPRLE